MEVVDFVEKEREKKPPILRRLERRNWIILGEMILMSLPFLSLRFSIGILAGGILSILSFNSLYPIVKKAILKSPQRAKAQVVFYYYIRLSLMGLFIYLLISNRLVNIIGLIIGLSVVVVNVVFSTIKDYKRIILEV
jgi:hypothetical protein